MNEIPKLPERLIHDDGKFNLYYLNEIYKTLAYKASIQLSKELQEELDNLDKFFYKTTKEQKEATEEWKRYQEIEEEIRKLRIRANAVSFVDPVDLRYNNFTKTYHPLFRLIFGSKL